MSGFDPTVDVPVRMITGVIPVTDEILSDCAAWSSIEDTIADAFDRHLYPWRYPDPHRFPSINVFPTATRLLARVAEVRARVAGAVDVLRHGVLLDEWEDD